MRLNRLLRATMLMLAQFIVYKLGPLLKFQGNFTRKKPRRRSRQTKISQNLTPPPPPHERGAKLVEIDLLNSNIPGVQGPLGGGAASSSDICRKTRLPQPIKLRRVPPLTVFPDFYRYFSSRLTFQSIHANAVISHGRGNGVLFV